MLVDRSQYVHIGVTTLSKQMALYGLLILLIDGTYKIILILYTYIYYRRLEECKNQLKDILKQEKLAGASLLIFANKQDLGGALSFQEIAEALDLNSQGNIE